MLSVHAPGEKQISSSNASRMFVGFSTPRGHALWTHGIGLLGSLLFHYGVFHYDRASPGWACNTVFHDCGHTI